MKWDIHIYDPKSETTTTHVKEYPGTTSRADAAAVTAYASRDFRKPQKYILAVPHHAAKQHHAAKKKTAAQLDAEIADILAGPTVGPGAFKPGQRVMCSYRGEHVGKVLGLDDPRAWVNTLAFPQDRPNRRAVKEHLLRHPTVGVKSIPVLYKFGVHWDTRDCLSPVSHATKTPRGVVTGMPRRTERSHATTKSRFWYFAELNERGGVRNRFGPFASKHEATLARKRAASLFREKRLDQVRSSIERFPSNVPNWIKS